MVGAAVEQFPVSTSAMNVKKLKKKSEFGKHFLETIPNLQEKIGRRRCSHAR